LQSRKTRRFVAAGGGRGTAASKLQKRTVLSRFAIVIASHAFSMLSEGRVAEGALAAGADI
jgi:hypothetical protein